MRSLPLARWAALGVLVALASPAWAQALHVSEFDRPAREPETTPVLLGAHDERFRDLPEARLRLRGDEDRVHWLRIAFELPPATDPHEQPLTLRFDRVAVDRLTVYLPNADGGRTQIDDGFFQSGDRAGPALNSYAFEIPHHLSGPLVVYAAVRGRTSVLLAPELVPVAGLYAQDRNLSSLLSAVYASIGVLMLSALALFLALRDRAYLHFCALTLGLLLLLAALNGHLYRGPPLAWLAWWHNNGIYGLAALCCALALGFTRHFLETAQNDAPADRVMTRVRRALFVFAAVCAFNPASLTPMLQSATAVIGVLSAILVLGVGLRAWLRGEVLARAYCLVWIILTLGVATRAALLTDWVPQNVATLYGFQVATAFCLFLMSIGLADRVMEFRKQRDRARQAKAQTDVSLQLEQVRRQFAESLRELLRQAAPSGDLEWVVLRRLLVSLRSALPQRGAALLAYGYHGLDLLLVEPLDSKERYAALFAARHGTLKGASRARKAVVLQLEEHPETGVSEASEEAESLRAASPGGQFALLPMPMAAPGWGALLIERDVGARFSADELELAGDFLAQAVAATDEARRQAELKHKAEVDPLTGANNRRAGDTMLEQAMRRSVDERKPFSVLFVDLDHFKKVNDVHGHAIGDDCLRLAAQTIRHEIRADDVLVRYGGEEFLVVLPGLAPELAAQLGERIRQAVLALRVKGEGGEVQFTVSIGVAGRLPGETKAQGMVERADRALYTAKHNGRNQVQSAQHFGYGKSGQDAEPPPPLSLAP